MKAACVRCQYVIEGDGCGGDGCLEERVLVCRGRLAPALQKGDDEVIAERYLCRDGVDLI